MSLDEWTKTAGAWVLDSGTKHSGNSSVKTSNQNAILSRGSYHQAKISAYFFTVVAGSEMAKIGFKHNSYGELLGQSEATQGWHRYKATFWYDGANDTKWGKIEKWVDPDWVQIGTDTNFGAGSPNADYVALITKAIAGAMFMDDIECYAESL